MGPSTSSQAKRPRIESLVWALGIGWSWYALELAFVAAETPPSQWNELIVRFLRFLPWHSALFLGVGVGVELLRGIGLPVGRGRSLVLWGSAVALLGARVAEGVLHDASIPRALLAVLAVAAGLGLAFGLVAALLRAANDRIAVALRWALGVGGSALFVGWLREAGPAIGLGGLGFVDALVQGGWLPWAVGAGTGLASFAIAGRRASAATLGLLCAAGVAAMPEATRAQPGPQHDVIVVLVDTLRADHFGGSEASSLTPELAERADEFFRFPNTWSTSTRTNLSMPGVFTGLSSRAVGTTLPESAVTLTERLAQAGHRTFGTSANPRVSAQFGYDQGFDALTGQEAEADLLVFGVLKLISAAIPSLAYRVGMADAELFYTRIHRLCRRALHWLDGSPGPTFLYLQTMDVHGPYLPPRRYLSEGYRGADFLSYYRFLRLSSTEALRDPAIEPGLQNLRERYAGEVRFTDVELARFFDELERRGRWDESLVWILSDHGESFGEHGFAGHGNRDVGDAVLRVPLWVKPPRSKGLSPRVVSAPASTFDVVPTTLGLLGLPPPDASFGRDLTGVLAGDSPDPERVVVSHTEYTNRFPLYAGVWGSWKLHFRDQADAPPFRELYDLSVDPGELEDRVRSRPEIAARIEAAIRERHALEVEYSLGGDAVDVDAAMKARLRALGYTVD